MYEKMTVWQQIRTQAMLALASLFVLVPVLWILRLAFEGNLGASGNTKPKSFALIPNQFTLDNFNIAWNSPSTGLTFSTLLTNSLIVAGSTMLIAVFFGTTAAYGFARFTFPGQKFGLLASLVLLTLPPAGLTAPYFLFFNELKIRDSLLSLITVYSAIAVPFAIWTVRNAVQGVPLEFEEAAMLEGSGRFRLFRQITLPLIAPSVAVAGFIAFTLAWSEFALGWVFISSPRNVTLAMALFNLRGSNGISWGLLSAMAVLVALPILILFYALGRYVISGLSLGAISTEN